MIKLTLNMPHEFMNEGQRRALHATTTKVLANLVKRGLSSIEVGLQKTFRFEDDEVAKVQMEGKSGTVYAEPLKPNHEKCPAGQKRYLAKYSVSLKDFVWPGPHDFEQKGYFFVVPCGRVEVDLTQGVESAMSQLGWVGPKVHPGVVVPTKDLRSAFARVRGISRLSYHFHDVVRLESTGSELIVTGVSAPAAFSREFAVEGPSFYGGARVPSVKEMSGFGAMTVVSQVDGQFVLTSGSSQIWLESGLDNRSMKHLKGDEREFMVKVKVKELKLALAGLKEDKAFWVEFVGGHMSGWSGNPTAKVRSFYGLSGPSNSEVSCKLNIGYLEKCLVGMGQREVNLWLGSEYLLIEDVKDPRKFGQRILGVAKW